MEKLGTKAETLQKLYQRLISAEVLPQICFTVSEWNARKDEILDRYEKLEWKESVVVRSSSLMEDTAEQSLAGKFESVLNVNGKENFIQATEQVIASYGTAGQQDQILVQPMLQNVTSCGVAFTIDPNTLGNYYCN